MSSSSSSSPDLAKILPETIAQIGNPSITGQITDLGDLATNMGRTIMNQRETESRYRILEQQRRVNKEALHLIEKLTVKSSSLSSVTTTIGTIK